MTRRSLRAGLLCAVVVAVFWLGLHAAVSGERCASTQTNEFGCLGVALVGAGVGLPVVAALTAWALAGKGFWHSVLGAMLCLLAGWWLTSWVLDVADFGGPEVVGLVATAPVSGVLVALWAAYAPGRAR